MPIEVSLSESSEAAGNLLRFNLPIITKRRSPVRPPALTNPTAYTLWDCGGSHKFVHPELISRLRTAGYAIKTRKRGQMNLVTAGRREHLPLHEARLDLDIGGMQYSGWFVIYKLAKYDAILGKSWMEEVPHRVDLGKNILRLGQDVPGGQFKFKLHGLPKDKGCQEWPDLGNTPHSTATPPRKQSRLPEIVDFMVAEITDEADFQKDCSKTWQKVFGKEPESQLQAADLEKIPRSEEHTSELQSPA